MEANLQLQNTLKVDNDTYDINAVNSEVAKRVQNQLKLQSFNYGYDSTLETYDGSSEKEIKFVSAEGGAFLGPIETPSIYTSDYVHSGNSILNYDDLCVLTSKLTGGMWYEWDGKRCTAVKENTTESGESTETQEYFLHMGIVLGKQENLEKFVIYNTEKKEIPFYLYLCSDSGNIFYGMAEDSTLKQLATNADSAINAEQAEIAKKLVSGLIDESSGKYPYEYTAEELAKQFENLADFKKETDENISKIEDRLTNIESNDITQDELINELTNGLSNVIIGTTTVSSAERATCDGDNKNISSNYYRKKNYTSTVNYITISTSAPTNSEGIDGDIWIKYSSN